ncbi:MAG: glycerophosphodiester phosphodiesterase [Acidimicrobiales bacterium]
MRENPWLDRRVICFAHQGGARENPSSTLHAITEAMAHGATAIELDVHATADGHLVVSHDPTLDRTTNITGEIVSHTLAELSGLDNAYWFVPGEDVQHDRSPADYPMRGRAPADRRYGIATLSEVFDVTEGIPLNLDIKRTTPDVAGYERALADLIRERGRTEDVIVASFIDAATDRFKEYAPEIATSAGTLAVAEFYRAIHAGDAPPDSLQRHLALQVPARYHDILVVDEAFVNAAHANGFAVHPWTVNDREEMGRLCDVGVDGIISDVPSVLAHVLEERGLTWRR